MIDNYEQLKNELNQTLQELDQYEISEMKENVFRIFNNTFSRESIDQLDYENTEYFFKSANKTIKTRVQYKKALKDFPQFKKGIKYLLYGNDPIDVRIENTLHFDQEGQYPYKIIGMQRSPTILLNMSDPDNYCIWNHNTQEIFFRYQLLYPIDDSWLMYNANNELQKKLASDLGIDLFTLDYLMRYHHKKTNQ